MFQSMTLRDLPIDEHPGACSCSAISDGSEGAHSICWGDLSPFKVQLAARLRAQTTVTLEWLAQRLGMGTRGRLAHLLYQHEHVQSQSQRVEQPRSNI